MLTPEAAQALLDTARVPGRAGARKAAVDRLPAVPRRFGEALLALGPYATTLSDEVQEAAGAFDARPEKDRRRLFRALFPRLEVHLEREWQLGKRQPYQTGEARRAFRAPDRPDFSLSVRASRLAMQVRSLERYEPDAQWVARWAAYLEGWYDPFGPLLAAAIDGGGSEGDAVFDLLVASASGEDEVGQMGRHVVSGLLASEREDGWDFVSQMLVAAQRQEGLRQVILETVDLSHPLAFRRMLALALEHGLTRFSSAARAIETWFGLQLEVGDTRGLDGILERTLRYLDDADARDAALRTGDGWDAYLALWAIAYDDAPGAVAPAETLLGDALPERRLAAAHLLGELTLIEGNQALVGALADEDPRVALRALRAFGWSPPSIEWPGLREALEALLERTDARSRQLEPLLLPGTGGKLGRPEVADVLLRHSASQPLEQLVRHLPHMNADTRYSFALRLDRERRRAALRPVVIELVGDASPSVRKLAIKAAATTPVDEHEAEGLELLLRRKAEDMRRGVVALLLNRPDARVLESADRLLAGDAPQRLGGLELLRRLSEADRAADAARARTEAFAATAAAHDGERLQVDAILSGGDDEFAELDHRLGLVDPAQLTRPAAPRKLGATLMSAAAIAALVDLDDLVHLHREERITIPVWEGEEQQLLGNVRSFPHPIARFGASSLSEPPLWELWRDWDARRSAASRDADGFELARALAPFHARESARYGEVSSDAALRTVTGSLKLPQLRYEGVVAGVLDWLLALTPPDALDAFALAAAETLLAGVPASDLAKKPPAQRWGWSSTWRHHGWLAYLELLRGRIRLGAASLSDDDWMRLWQLERWVADPTAEGRAGVGARMRKLVGSAAPEREAPPLAVVLAVHARGAATDADVLEHLLSPPNAGYHGADLRDLKTVSGRRRDRRAESDARIEELVARIRERAVAIELRRGEAPTVASHAALALRFSGGLETLAPVLRRLGKEPFVRGWTYDGQSTKNVLSHLVRASVPGEADTPEAFAEALRELRLSEKRLVELAAFAPQWARHAERGLAWPGLATAIWWLHAHTKDTSWTVDTEIRELWAAEVAERTPLTSDDLIDGAVDMDWFQAARTRLGASRWKVVDAAAKYCSTGGGHRRAQLFAESMLGLADEAGLQKRIDDKRHQDSVRALGLLPLPRGARRDEAVLRRYCALEEFRRQSRQFGSQRQQSERRAVEVGLANLARTAGYRDPLRLSWAMEARGVADLGEGALTEVVDGVTLALTLDADGVPELGVSRDGKELKSVPAKLRSRPEVKALRARVADLRRQGARVRSALEGAMVRGDSFSGAELHELSAHLVLYPRLERLVLVGEGTAGFPAGGGRTLVDHAGAMHAVGPGEELRVAHPLDLLALGDWHAWQRHCLGARIVQPFKQVFRELYVPTRDERGATVSRRYAGNQLQPRQALALLGGRGWVAHPEVGRAQDVSRRAADRRAVVPPGLLHARRRRGADPGRCPLLPLRAGRAAGDRPRARPHLQRGHARPRSRRQRGPRRRRRSGDQRLDRRHARGLDQGDHRATRDRERPRRAALGADRRTPGRLVGASRQRERPSPARRRGLHHPGARPAPRAHLPALRRRRSEDRRGHCQGAAARTRPRDQGPDDPRAAARLAGPGALDLARVGLAGTRRRPRERERARSLEAVRVQRPFVEARRDLVGGDERDAEDVVRERGRPRRVPDPGLLRGAAALDVPGRPADPVGLVRPLADGRARAGPRDAHEIGAGDRAPGRCRERPERDGGLPAGADAQEAGLPRGTALRRRDRTAGAADPATADAVGPAAAACNCAHHRQLPRVQRTLERPVAGRARRAEDVDLELDRALLRRRRRAAGEQTRAGCGERQCDEGNPADPVHFAANVTPGTISINPAERARVKATPDEIRIAKRLLSRWTLVG